MADQKSTANVMLKFFHGEAHSLIIRSVDIEYLFLQRLFFIFYCPPSLPEINQWLRPAPSLLRLAFGFPRASPLLICSKMELVTMKLELPREYTFTTSFLKS